MEHFFIAGTLLLLLALIIFIIVRAGKGIRRGVIKQALTERTTSNVIVTAKNQKSVVTFQFKNANKVDYAVPEYVYNDVQINDKGNLTFQGSRFIRFVITGR
ncbi:MAG: DUF2500 family protein [Candidatus Pelethousia sp.]|nr:DUF2500 family protein [Candidatus Pelethousia sp.]